MSKDYNNGKEFQKALKTLEEFKRTIQAIKELSGEMDEDEKKLSMLKNLLRIVQSEPFYIK